MAKRSLSSLKRVRQNAKRAERNKSRRSALKSQVRVFLDAANTGKADAASKEFLAASAQLDRAASHGIIHKNTAGRRKSRLAKRLNALKPGGATAGAKPAKTAAKK